MRAHCSGSTRMGMARLTSYIPRHPCNLRMGHTLGVSPATASPSPATAREPVAGHGAPAQPHGDDVAARQDLPSQSHVQPASSFPEEQAPLAFDDEVELIEQALAYVKARRDERLQQQQQQQGAHDDGSSADFAEGTWDESSSSSGESVGDGGDVAGTQHQQQAGPSSSFSADDRQQGQRPAPPPWGARECEGYYGAALRRAEALVQAAASASSSLRRPLSLVASATAAQPTSHVPPSSSASPASGPPSDEGEDDGVCRAPDGPLTYEAAGSFAVRLLDGIDPSQLPNLPRERYQLLDPDDMPFDDLPSTSYAPWSPASSARAQQQRGPRRRMCTPAAVLLRGHQLSVSEIPPSVCCVARCGPGSFTNVPIGQMTELGIPVFNTPGANANAVKELVVCALLLASRGILEGAAHVRQIYEEEKLVYGRVVQRINDERGRFHGTEIEGKTLGVVGLGAVGSRVVGAALALGMQVVGFDPWISPEASWKLPGDRMMRAERLEDLLMDADYITLHVPYFNLATHHLLNASNLSLCKQHVHLLNFSPAQIVDGAAVLEMYRTGKLTGRYIADFADPYLQGHPRHLVLPHLGACTREAEDKSAAMAAATVREFLESGNVRHSVNFPPASLKRKPFHDGPRLCIVVQNEPGVLGAIATFLGSRGVNIEQETTASRGALAYTMLDVGPIADPAQLQIELARECPGIISSRFIHGVPLQGRERSGSSSSSNSSGNGSGGGLASGSPHTLFNINLAWPTLDSFEHVELREHASFSEAPWTVGGDGEGEGGGSAGAGDGGDLGSREDEDDEDDEVSQRRA